MKFLPNRNTWIQILFWGVLWVLIPFLLSNNWELTNRHVVRSILVFSGVVAVIWANGVWLMPTLYFKKRYGWYVLAAVGLLLVVVTIIYWESAPWAEYLHRMGPGRRRKSMDPNPAFLFMKYFSRAIPYFTALIGSTLFEIASFAQKKEKEAAEFRSEKLGAEIKFLKSQTNPHFLFNALNNIYTLTLLKSDKAPDHLLKLSDMLRYMLYECKADRVPLQKEIDYLQHFIDLQLLKDSRGLNVSFDFKEVEPDLEIAPMLLIPFVENAFKHSKIEDLKKGWIKVKLHTSGKTLYFEALNSKPQDETPKDEQGGIGLDNVRRQLELLYPDQHELQIEDTKAQYSVSLRINLA